MKNLNEAHDNKKNKVWHHAELGKVGQGRVEAGGLGGTQCPPGIPKCVTRKCDRFPTGHFKRLEENYRHGIETHAGQYSQTKAVNLKTTFKNFHLQLS